MANISLLTARQVDTLADGFHADGGNLFLKVKGNGRSWVFRYKQSGKARDIGMGATHTRSLKEAREMAELMRKQVKLKKDPIGIVRVKPDIVADTFRTLAGKYIAEYGASWRNPKHRAQWSATLEQYAYPIIGNKVPADVTLADLKLILMPIWTDKIETATRVRQRIEAVLDYAAVSENQAHRYNPARLKGNLDKAGMGKQPNKSKRVTHFPAAEHNTVPAIMAALREKNATSAYCLRFIIMTACRSGEARGATWDEIDLVNRMWTIPANRIKAEVEHRVPLNDEAMEILETMSRRLIAGVDRIFPGERGGLLSDVAVSKILHRVVSGVTVHGFRSSFREWGAVPYPARAMETALAHANKNKVEAAYQRDNYFELRIEIMAAWGRYCAGGDNVIQLIPKHNAA